MKPQNCKRCGVVPGRHELVMSGLADMRDAGVPIGPTPHEYQPPIPRDLSGVGAK